MVTLARPVGVQHPDTHEYHSFVPGQELPDWAVPLVINPAAFEADAPTEAEAETSSGDGDSGEQPEAAGQGDDPAGGVDQQGSPEPEPPAGEVDLDGMSKDELLAHADILGLDVDRRLGAEKLADQIRTLLEGG